MANYSLTPKSEAFIRERTESGDYNNASEVVRDAIRLLKHAEEEREIKLAKLKDAINDGDEAIAKGQSSVFNSAEDLDNFFDQL